MASAMLTTWNSSKQSSRCSLARSAARIAQRILVPAVLPQPCRRRCTSSMNSWKCVRRLARDGCCREEQVHQHRLAAPDPAMEVDPARSRRGCGLAAEAEAGEEAARGRRGRRRAPAPPARGRAGPAAGPRPPGPGRAGSRRARAKLCIAAATWRPRAMVVATGCSGSPVARSTGAQAAARRSLSWARSAPVATSTAPAACRPVTEPPTARAISIT